MDAISETMVEERIEFGASHCSNAEGDEAEGNVKVIAFHQHSCDEIRPCSSGLGLVLVSLLLDDTGGTLRTEVQVCPVAMLPRAVYGSP
jgi:hypothetical protein